MSVFLPYPVLQHCDIYLYAQKNNDLENYHTHSHVTVGMDKTKDNRAEGSLQIKNAIDL